VRLHAQQPLRLRIQIANDTRLVDGVDAFDDAAEHCLRLGLAPAQLAGELHQVVAHGFDRARKLADFLRAPDRDRGREVAAAELADRIAQCAERTGDLLTEDHAREHGEHRQHDCRDEQPAHEAADRGVDLARRQPCFQQHDGFAG
jgi:hypothetical protein